MGPENHGCCPVCNHEFLPAEWGELCGVCLFAVALAKPSPENIIGDYELLHRLGEGGMGQVYIARHAEHGNLVALKVAKPEILERPEGVAAFQREIKTACELNHPHIARIHTSGTHDGRPYLVMQLLEGTLADKANREKYREPKRAIDLMIKIARAVQFAHRRFVLHCDLKPENILFDSDGEPYVSDFGLMRAIGSLGVAERGVMHGGTRGWISPEQLEGESLTMASDVFSLGVMLYWLLGREMPFGSDAEFTRRVLEDDPPYLPHLVPGLAWEHGAICMKALQKTVDERYRTARDFAEDLERLRDGRPLSMETYPLRRAGKWVRRRLSVAAPGILLSFLLLYVFLMPISVLKEVKDTIREQNAFSATAQAGAVMNELRSFMRRVEVMARDPEVLSLVEHPDLNLPAPALARHEAGFDVVSVLESDGTWRARSPIPGDYEGVRNFEFRDYFAGQKRLGAAGKRDVYVSRAIRSTLDNEIALAFSAPLFDANGKYVGAVLGLTKARSTFGAVQMNCAGTGSCLTALLGPRDRDSLEGKVPATISVLAETGLARGEEKIVDPALTKKICERFNCSPGTGNQFELDPKTVPLVIENYDDLVSHTRSIAALAPVGASGLIVLVATPESAADALLRRMIDRMKYYVGVPVFLAFLLLAALWAVPALFVPKERKGRTTSHREMLSQALSWSRLRLRRRELKGAQLNG